MTAHDPILVLNHDLAAAWARWQPAQEAAERIEFSVSHELRDSPEGIAWLGAAGYVAARVRENQLRHAAERIELKIAKTAPTTLLGILALARLVEANHRHVDARDRRMLARVIEALEAMPPAPATDIVLTLACKVRDEYSTADDDTRRGRMPLGSGMLPAMIVALEALAAPRAVA
jgi:hypothetical protein